MATRCFLLVDTKRVRISLRRYHSRSEAEQKCTVSGLGYHNAKNYIEDRPTIYAEEQHGKHDCYHGIQEHDLADPRWPTHCACGYAFTDADPKQVFQDTILRRTDTGDEMTWREAPPGAMRDCCWMHSWCGDDGMSLLVKCPNGVEWLIDGPARNCTNKDDMDHRCWCRHGNPPDIWVDKSCNTCAAGAGSIQAGDYHGFLGCNGAPPGYFT